MYFSVISIMPDMFSAISSFGITSRAIETGKVQLDCINPRDFTTDNYQRIDNKPYGGGPGMVMMPEPLGKAIEYAKKRANEYGCRVGTSCRQTDEHKGAFCPVVYLSPQGQQLSEQVVVEMNQYDGMILLCGRYEGVDERILAQYVDKQISIGDYVLTGGELPAMVLMDSVIRRLPDVMGDERSAEQDSFVDGLLDCPHYTKPRVFNNIDVPEVLMSGNHSNIAEWRFIQQVLNTQKLRPDLWQSFIPTKEQEKWLSKNSIDY